MALALKKRLQITLCFLLLSLGACGHMLNDADMLNMSSDEAVTIMAFEAIMDGKRTNKGLSSCHLMIKQIDKQNSTEEEPKYNKIKSSSIDDTDIPGKRYLIIKSKPSPIQLSQLSCLSYKGLYNKTRLVNIAPPYRNQS
jgi:hypothetical protein